MSRAFWDTGTFVLESDEKVKKSYSIETEFKNDRIYNFRYKVRQDHDAFIEINIK